jgi:hypothetical protein
MLEWIAALRQVTLFVRLRESDAAIPHWRKNSYGYNYNILYTENYIYIYTHHHKKISILYVLRWLMGWSIPRHFHKPFLGPSSVHCAMLTFVAAPLSAHAVAPVREAPLAREGRGSGLVGWSSNEWRLYMISMGIYCNWIWWPLNPLIVWVRWIWLYIYIFIPSGYD